MQLNSVDLVERQNRPTVIQKVALRAYFVNNGEYYDPYDISGVTIFEKSSNLSPSTVVSSNVVLDNLEPTQIKAHFEPSSHPGDVGYPGYTGQDPESYNPGVDENSLSSVYRVGTGKYLVVLDGTQDWSGLYSFYGSSVEIPNSVSAVGDYLDVWTVKFNEGSTYQSLIQEFKVYDDTFFTVTEPIQFSTKTKLVNKHLTLSSIDVLKFPTEITLENNVIDDSIKNLFKQSVITSASVKIDKINEGSVTLPAHVTVSGYDDTSGIVNITSDNTILCRFDTTQLASHPEVSNFGGLTGTYRATVKYTLLDELVITPPFYFIVS